MNAKPSAKTHLSVHANVSAPWHAHARPRSLRLRMKDRPGHVSVPDYMTAFAAVKTRCRAPSNGVSIPELASTAPVSPSLSRTGGGYVCATAHVRGETQPFGCRPQRTGPSLGRPAWRLASSPHEGHRSRLALAPQGVADTERMGVWHGVGGLGRCMRNFFL